jgi:prephenate dehydrogenase
MNPTIALIGGAGQMGRWLERFFQSRGYPVLIADVESGLSAPEAASRAEVVILCVPIPAVAQVAREVGPHLKPGAALMDIASVKQRPLAAMLDAFPGEVVGTHPLFGPGEPDIRGLTVVLCPGRGERWFQWLKNLLQEAGARVRVTTATEHDRLMSVVQGLAHFILIALGATMRQMGVTEEDVQDFATPTFGTLLSLTRKLLSQDAKLYACIQVQNPANRLALRAFNEAVGDILYYIQRQDVAGLVRLLEEIK